MQQIPDVEKIFRMMTYAGAALIILIIFIIAIMIIPPYLSLHSNQEQADTQNEAAAQPPQLPEDIVTVIKNMLVPDETPAASIAGAGDTLEIIESYTPDDPEFTRYSHDGISGMTAADYDDDSEYYQILYRKTETDMKYNPTSLKVNAEKGPLAVHFRITNVKNTDGSTERSNKYETSHEIPDVPNVNPYNSYFEISIQNVTPMPSGIDPVCIYGGYAREYPAIENQTLIVYAAGEYRIDYYGLGLDADVAVITGTVKENQKAVTVSGRDRNKFEKVLSSAPASENKASAAPQYWLREVISGNAWI